MADHKKGRSACWQKILSYLCEGGVWTVAMIQARLAADGESGHVHSALAKLKYHNLACVDWFEFTNPAGTYPRTYRRNGWYVADPIDVKQRARVLASRAAMQSDLEQEPSLTPATLPTIAPNTRINLADAAPLLRPDLTIATLVKYIVVGVRLPDKSRLKLRADRVGAKWVTTPQWIREFIDTQTAAYLVSGEASTEESGDDGT